VVRFTVEKSVVFLSVFFGRLGQVFFTRSKIHYFPNSIRLEARNFYFSLDFCHLWFLVYSHLWLLFTFKTVLQVLPLVNYQDQDK
jgi:hypothetical protein